ncbi:MAG TPA: aminoacyl-tRNA hydrolase [Clostridiales bacterium]|nr:aminoacyl-tRNA hydrolase [Clostridiales bacterium]
MFFKKSEKSGPVDFLIVGLGNPGKKYEGTRHNAGFMVLEALAEKMNVKINRVKFKSFCGECTIGGRRVLLMMPQTYMNSSGEAVSEAMRFYKLQPEQVCVIFDDITLPVGRIRIRRKGSDGGQRGMRSIIMLTGSENFPRVRVGIGEKPHPDYDLSDWVLSKFSREEAEKLLPAINQAAEAACIIAQGDIDRAMNMFSK